MQAENRGPFRPVSMNRQSNLPLPAALFAALIWLQPAVGAELAVPDDFDSIQAAVDEAESGDVILIAPGAYRQDIVVEKDITLRGEETARTLIEAATGDGPAILVQNTGNVTIRNLTFLRGSPGIEINNSNGTDILNNVFELSGAGIEVTDPTGTPGTIAFNSFIGNSTAISNAADFTIDSNLFAGNSTAASPEPATGDPNCFDSGDDTFGSGGDVEQGDIEFADPSRHDYHLREGSECIDDGSGTDVIDGTTADAGVYGGPDADVAPFPPQGVEVSDASAGDPPVFAVEVNWEQNHAYRTEGYKLYYGSEQSGVYDGTDADTAGGAPAESPVDVGDATTFTLHNLSAPNEEPGVPELEEPSPGNERLALSWSAVDGATGYRVHYGLGSPDENRVDVGEVTEYALTGLQNGSVYRVQVSALSQATYYIAVTTVDTEDNESAFSGEQSIGVGEEQEGGRSNTVTGIPEEVVPYPELPDQGDSRCFIATAAYSSPDAPDVQILRAFRDRYLLGNRPGRAFVRWYYRHGPGAAAWLNRHPAAKPWVRAALQPAVWLARAGGWVIWLLPAALALVLWWPGSGCRRRRSGQVL